MTGHIKTWYPLYALTGGIFINQDSSFRGSDMISFSTDFSAASAMT